MTKSFVHVSVAVIAVQLTITHRTTESNTLIGYITLVILYNQWRQMGSQNSFYCFVIQLIKCNDFDSYEKTDNHFVSYNNKILQKPRYQLKILWRMQFLVHFAWLVLRLTLKTGKNMSFSRICRFFVCTEYFCKHMMCIGIKIFIFEEEFIPYLNEQLWT